MSRRDAPGFQWKVRARRSPAGGTTVYARRHSFAVGAQASFKENDDRPSALEYLLGALAGDLVAGLSAEAARRGLPIDDLEVSLAASLDNPLVLLGVVGEEGRPGLDRVTATVYVSGEADEGQLGEAWQAA
ncbi:MAG TPA: hypothetical protein VNO81_07335, partial [Candidatus Nitrosotenuis sp.]|nr:hypothetical protein [Candidatus Nitrosotenuis sp.]